MSEELGFFHLKNGNYFVHTVFRGLAEEIGSQPVKTYKLYGNTERDIIQSEAAYSLRNIIKGKPPDEVDWPESLIEIAYILLENGDYVLDVVPMGIDPVERLALPCKVEKRYPFAFSGKEINAAFQLLKKVNDGMADKIEWPEYL